MGRKRGEVMAAALAFISASNPEDEIFVANFNDKVVPGLPSDVLFTNDHQVLRRALSRAPSEGRTALNDAVGYSIQRLSKGSMDKKALLVVSDGGDNASVTSATDVIKQVRQGQVTIYTIGIFNENDPDRNPRFLGKLARISGGEYFHLQELPEIVPVCRRIADDIRNRYTIAYRPPHGGAGRSEHSIKVVASAPSRGHLNVLARTRYDMLEPKP
jgi:VWFA-related protein